MVKWRSFEEREQEIRDRKFSRFKNYATITIISTLGMAGMIAGFQYGHEQIPAPVPPVEYLRLQKIQKRVQNLQESIAPNANQDRTSLESKIEKLQRSSAVRQHEIGLERVERKQKEKLIRGYSIGYFGIIFFHVTNILAVGYAHWARKKTDEEFAVLRAGYGVPEENQ